MTGVGGAIVAFGILFGLVVFLCVMVYRDAQRRGMSAPLWTAVVVLVPYFVGLIIYVVARANHPELQCSACGAQVNGEFMACPQCGVKLRAACGACATPAEPGWKVCPQCATPLPEAFADVYPPVRVKGISGWKVILVAVLVPVIAVLIAVQTFAVQGSSYSASYAQIPVEDWLHEAENPDEQARARRVLAWVDEMRAQGGGKVCALCYEEETPQGTAYYCLIYAPGVSAQAPYLLEESAGLFGTTVYVELYPAGEDEVLIDYVSVGKRAPKLEVRSAQGNYECEVTMVDYNPTLTAVVY